MYLNGFYLILNILQVTHNDKDTWTLVIKNVRQKDGGEYMCQVNSVPMVSQVIRNFIISRLNKIVHKLYYLASDAAKTKVTTLCHCGILCLDCVIYLSKVR